jgi:hypothetical protein
VKLLTKLWLPVLMFAALVSGVMVAVSDFSREVIRFYQVRSGFVVAGNTITNLIPLLYEALDQVQREIVGFITAVGRDSSAERAALNQTINIYISPPATTQDITPGITAPNDGDAVFGNTTMTISKSKYSPIRWSGEEQKAVNGTGNRRQVVIDQYAQSIRALVNLVEVDLATVAYQSASRAFGTAGNTPFATAADLSDIAQLWKILDDNGTGKTDRHLVLGTTAMANLKGKHSELFKVNEAGTDSLLRRGVVGDLQGWQLHDSAAILTPTKGTGASYTTTAAGFAVGTTSIPLITGTGTVLAGDVVTFAGDSNKYVVATGIAAPGTIVLNSPGLKQAIPASTTALTVGNTAAQNVGFQRGYIQLATRTPAMPEEGDMADDVTEITDPVSGLSFQVAMYRQYRQVKFEIGLAWGFKAIKGDGIANLLG